MEVNSEILGDQDVRPLWTRFEGLVGNQLYRLRADGTPVPLGSPHSTSSAGHLPDVTRSSSMCSAITSDQSSLSLNSSPARMQALDHGLSLGSDGCGQVVDSPDNYGRVSRARGNSFNISEEVIRFRCNDYDGDGDGEGNSSRDDHMNGGCGDGGSMVVTSTSCCLLPSEESVSVRSNSDGYGQLMRRNASSNALNTSETQKLFGLPYVARAAGPLLSLTTVTLEEWAGQGGPHSGDSLVKLEKRRQESGRSMLDVYKQSLLLESQLHQYLNPGLVTSLNRRVARATFEAEAMVSLIDKLRKEARKAVTDTDRTKNVVEVSTKLKSLLGRQKCEWQCVGRLKETLTMAREMKELLKFIARLSNLLERSKLAIGSMQERPPPYDYCSPYSDGSKPGWPCREAIALTGSSQNQLIGTSLEECAAFKSPCGSKKIEDAADSGESQEQIKTYVRNPSPKKVFHPTTAQRTSSSDCNRDSAEKKADHDGIVTSNINLSNSVDREFLCSERPTGKRWPSASPIIVNTMHSSERSRETRYKKSPITVPTGSSDVMRELNHVMSSKFPITNCSGGSSLRPCLHAGGECNSGRKTTMYGSPPRACPKKRDTGLNSCFCSKQKKNRDDSCDFKKRGNSPRWDGGSSRNRSKISDIEGHYKEPSDQSSSCHSSETGLDTSANSQSNLNKGRSSPGKNLMKVKSGASELNENTSAEPEPDQTPTTSGKGTRRSSTVTQSKKGTIHMSEGGADNTQTPDSDEEGSEGSGDDSDDIFIDIEQQYKNKDGDTMKAPGSGPNSCGHRRIRVRVKRSQSGTSNSKRHRSASKSRSRSKSPRTTPSQKNTDETIEEAGTTEDASDLQKATSIPEVPESPEPLSGKTSRVTASKTPSGGLLVEYESDSSAHDNIPEGWRARSAHWLRNSGIPGAEYLADLFDDPYKLAFLGFILFLILYNIFMWLFFNCCGCGYFPNPFFIFTNHMARRVTIRHGGLAPT